MLDPAAVERALARHRLRSLSAEGFRLAAVLVPLYRRKGNDYLLLTRRTERMNHHRGEIAFPGGVRHSEDADLEATALRETEEEVGIPASSVSVLGRLDDFLSVHGYRVSPFVGAFPRPALFRTCPDEIAELIELPLEKLADPGRWRREDWQHRGRRHPVHFCTVEGYEIWGLTAAILRQFLKRIDLL